MNLWKLYVISCDVVSCHVLPIIDPSFDPSVGAEKLSAINSFKCSKISSKSSFFILSE